MSELLNWTFRSNRSGRKVKIPGYRLTKDGKLIKDVKRLDVSAQLRMRGSKRVRVVPRGKT
jgi:inner membrane protein involved in colicin E2 resistance